jgi:hypothetical protein
MSIIALLNVLESLHSLLPPCSYNRVLVPLIEIHLLLNEHIREALVFLLLIISLKLFRGNCRDPRYFEQHRIHISLSRRLKTTCFDLRQMYFLDGLCIVIVLKEREFLFLVWVGRESYEVYFQAYWLHHILLVHIIVTL